MSASCRLMTMEDLDAIMEVEHEAFSIPWSRKSFTEELERNACARYLVVEDEGKVVGYGGMWFIVDEAHVTNIAIAKAHRGRGLGKLLMENMLQFAADSGMAFMTLFAITNVVCFDDVELLNIPLPEGLVKLCGIFRASGRMFYPVYYVLMTACIVGLARLLRRVGKAALYPAVLVLVAAVQLFDLSAMIAEKHTAMAETAAKPQPYPQELVDCRDNYGTLMLADDIIHARNVICAAWHPGMVTNGYDVNTYTGAWNVTIDWTAQTSAAVDSGTLDPDTLYVTGDADRFASWQAQYGDKADYITWDIAATGIYDRRDEYYFMAPKQ